MSKGDINKLICFGAFIAGITMFVIGTKRKNTAKIAIKKIDDAVKDVANKTVTDISDEIMHKAAEKAAERAAEKAVEKVRSDISNKVACAISEIYDKRIKRIIKSQSFLWLYFLMFPCKTIFLPL